LHEINLEVWHDHIHWAVHPVRVFAVPFVVSLPEAKWIRTSREGGLFLDRARLVSLGTRSATDTDLQGKLRQRVRELAAR
jgi:hypothetical protein